MVEFFIRRPKFAMVLALVMTIAGILAFSTLPVARFPAVAPPSVNVFAYYPGANAEIVRQTVGNILEQEINGVDGMTYMSSSHSNEGTYNLYVTFEVGFDEDRATQLVQNRVNKGLSRLPSEVQRNGIFVEAVSSSAMMYITLDSPEGTYDDLFLSNYAYINLKDKLLRVNGITKVDIMAEKRYAMRVWTDPKKMASLGITAADVTVAINLQNIAVSGGRLGGSPSIKEQQLQYPLWLKGRLKDIEEFKEIIVKANPDGSKVILSDIATVELGAEQALAYPKKDGKAAAVLAVYRKPSANVLEVGEGVKQTLADAEKLFPADVAYDIAYDGTKIVEVSVDEVMETLIIAIILVMAVVYTFLQSWRTTLIPCIAIPVSLIATFAFMSMMGLSINTITLFGLVLSIGILVDAAIVVLENIERLLAEEEDITVLEATQKSMKQVTAPLIASAAVLLAVFGPISFMPGMVGILYAQFGMTLSIAVVLSTVNALTLTPALAVVLLKKEAHQPIAPLRAFNRFIDKTTSGYVSWLRILCKRLVFAVALFGTVIGGIVFFVQSTPQGFIPAEDQSMFLVEVALPEGTALERTDALLDQMVADVNKIEGVRSVTSVSGYSLLNSNVMANSGIMVVSMEYWDKRPNEEQSEWNVIGQVWYTLSQYPEAIAMPFSLPSIPGLGTSGGMELRFQDTRDSDATTMQDALNVTLPQINELPEVAMAYSVFSANFPAIYADIDRDKVSKLGISLQEVYSAINGTINAMYINDFNLYGKVWSVFVQADAKYRTDETALENVFLRANDGTMVPLSTVVTTSTKFGAESFTAYNQLKDIQVFIEPAPGVSTGQAMVAVEKLMESAPQGFVYEWTGEAYEQKKLGNAAPFMFALAMLFVYLFLVAQYESWVTPISILLCVPTALIGSFGAVYLTGGDINLFTQVGLVLMIGMAARNAILIVEFCKELREERKMSIYDAAIEGAKLRLRPVIMTSFTFILGVIPLVIASGAGEFSRKAIGIVSFGGMITTTIAGCIFVPVFFLMFQRMREKFNKTKIVEQEQSA